MGKLDDFKRILIIGNNGSGKSVLAQKLGTQLRLPVHHLDTLYWLPNWIKQEREIMGQQIREITENPEWIIEGNYRVALEERMRRSQLIIKLDLPLKVCIQNVKKRHASGVFVGMPNHGTINPYEDLDDLINLSKIFEEKYAEFKPLFNKHQNKTLVLKSMKEANELLNLS